MTRIASQTELEVKSQQLLQGPLQHVRAAALAAALLPLASVAAAPAQAEPCASGGICGTVQGTVFEDANNNGVQDDGEFGIGDAVMTVTVDGIVYFIGVPDGLYLVDLPPGTHTLVVQIPPGGQPSPGTDVCPTDQASVCATVTVGEGSVTTVNFGFSLTTLYENPGTGTPGYWKNHPEAWPVASITIGYITNADGSKTGGTTYTQAEAISWLQSVGKDKRTTMFSSLVPAMLNVMVGNDPRCVENAIRDANAWMSTRLPMEDPTKKVAASSAAWKAGEPLHQTMDNYNNGGLCAPHRD